VKKQPCQEALKKYMETMDLDELIHRLYRQPRKANGEYTSETIQVPAEGS
jgi:hypothetical protein